MKLEFLKIENIVETEKNKIIYIPAGGIQFGFKNKIISLKDPLRIVMTHGGSFLNVVRYIDFVVYDDLSIYTTGEIKRESLFGIVANDEVILAIHKALEKSSKDVPFYRSLDFKEMYNRDFEEGYDQSVNFEVMDMEI
ncbi:molecular chaperone [Solibacillus sp. A46]|uniref:Molecular chaperone n=1 Tax=Solibacillus faecavium TaxID=2762221 RepID=A0ABR8Y2Y4_9BACL|nr:molecular chaperone [Solibacillus faecavium]MBD8038501.1 molecular chaperone [Solibacillus faecavium]